MKYRKYELAIFCLLEAAFKIHLAQKSLWMGMTPLPPFITLLSSVKKWSRLNQERNLHRSSTVYKCWSGVDYCDVFISCLDSYSDGTHSLQSIHWWDSGVMLHFSKSDEDTNSSTSWMAWGWAHFQQVFIFERTNSLKTVLVNVINNNKH